VHRAKGLEFPVVILTDPTCPARSVTYGFTDSSTAGRFAPKAEGKIISVSIRIDYEDPY